MWKQISDKLKSVVSNITIEPTFFFFALAQGFYIVIASSLYISKVCNVNLNYSMEICENVQVWELSTFYSWKSGRFSYVKQIISIQTTIFLDWFTELVSFYTI